ncbi:NFX1-type zinc finger-containing protein 1-like [Anneissia japonica]|uniref:NFX1-type zinc finger-containing protein 1-like n=1 Tax=Anneissia japonica TaxID=1529436 RepID=UPI0014254BA6|nr:NFX1-type zinc finger-containing protein 1-like [Anneissia japonica]
MMSGTRYKSHSRGGQGSHGGRGFRVAGRQTYKYSSIGRLNLSANDSFGDQGNANDNAGNFRDSGDASVRRKSRPVTQHSNTCGRGRNISNSRTESRHQYIEAGLELTHPSTNSGSRSRREIRATGYKRLEELLSKDKAEALIQLSSTYFGFEKLLNEPEIRRDLRTLICRVLIHACQCTTSTVSLNALLSKVQNSMFIKYHMHQHIMALKDERSPRVRHEVEIQDIITVIRILVERLPSATGEVKASLMLLELTMEELYEVGLIYDRNIRSRFDELKEFVKEVEKTQGEKVKPATRRKINNIDDDIPPPNNFRDIPIFPTLEDLTMDKIPFLRKNKLDGSYDNADHYLDVQFRLLREDMIRPLREGIIEYLQHKHDRHRRITDIRVYNDVTVEYPICSHDCIIYKVHFDVSRLKGVRWQSTKRLIYGSLVCLSKDDFQTVYFATVANSKPRDLENGFLDLKFEIQGQVENTRNEKFTMVETSSFFEAYRHVLLSLQMITEQNMPMKKYIIEGRHEVNAPYYLRYNRNMTYDLGPLIDEDTRKPMLVKIASNTWPSPSSLQLDDSQFNALKTALTKEFAVIQGPPGTGKTYVGLKIVHALLHNRKYRKTVHDEINESPIFIISYTNHALDQFLEGIHSFYPDGIVRVGGRSSSETLKKFNLNNLRQESRERKEVPRHIRVKKRFLFQKIDALRYNMENSIENIKLTTTGVIHTRFLRKWMRNGHYKSFTECRENQSMISWLSLDEVNMNLDIDTRFSVIEINDKEENEEGEQLEVAEESDLIAEKRVLDIDDADEEDAMRTTRKIRNTVRKQLAFDPDQMERFKDEDSFQLSKRDRQKRMRTFKLELQKTDKMSYVEAARVQNVWRLQRNDRWRLYRFWISQYCDHERHLLYKTQEDYSTLGKQLQEIRLEEDILLIRNEKVIGMTTTGAARCRNMIKNIKPKIVIVEEAAEVLEAHIVSSLTEGCEHLILIGDHQQLRPNPTVYDLAKRYNLEISLFERMVKNGMHCERLNTQHRMRPEISSLMKNHFYKGLQDAPIVHSYEKVKGVASNMLFIDHDHKEASVKDTLSKSNVYEAEFLVSLCKYMIQQGYNPSEITILTTYTGQLLHFKKNMKSEFFKGVRVCSVDNFQGEENEIILLSLVRSNDEGRIGFLKEKNRMCVALSRAKKGLFCIGNMKLLTRDDHWRKIVTELRQKNLLSKTIRLCCQNHPGRAVDVQEPLDFMKCPEGGCNERCVYRLKCGHVCKLSCHPYDPEHKNIKCSRPCVKQLPCGHACKEECSQPCTSTCREIVSKLWPCGHKGEYQCHVDDPLSCSNPCGVILKCGHLCQGTCGGCTNGRLHQQCRSKCNRTLVCGHGCLEPCTRNCPPCSKSCENRCVHNKCPNKCGEKCTPCTMPCEWRCQHKQCTMQCGQLCNRRRCDKPCKNTLSCGHQCAGLCGELCPRKCLICDNFELTTIMFGSEDKPNARFIQLEDCGHVIESTALDVWMDLEDDGNTNVQSKDCPICKTPIRRNLRYGNIIKELQMDIECMKSKIIGDEYKIRHDKIRLQREIQRLSDKECGTFLLTELNALLTAEQVSNMENKLQFVSKVDEINKAGDGKINARYADIEKRIKKELDICKKLILMPRYQFSEQMLHDIASELQRLSFYMELYVLKSELRNKSIISETLADYVRIVKKHVTSIGPLKEKDVKTTIFCLKIISRECGVVPCISDKERVQIV